MFYDAGPRISKQIWKWEIETIEPTYITTVLITAVKRVTVVIIANRSKI